MLWVKAFHIIFMVTWFAGLCLYQRTIGLLPEVRRRWPRNQFAAASVRCARARPSPAVK